jgi:hypothetical protein
MVRIDTITTSTVKSPYLIDYSIDYNMLLPPVINNLLTTHISNPNGFLTNQHKLSIQQKVNLDYNSLSNHHNDVDDDDDDTFSSNQPDENFYNKHNNNQASLRNNGNNHNNSKLNQNNNDQKTNNNHNNTNLTSKILPGSHIYYKDPFLFHTSNSYSFPLKWTRFKYFPLAIPSNFQTIKSLYILTIISSILNKIPAMSSPLYQELFTPFPVSFAAILNGPLSSPTPLKNIETALQPVPTKLSQKDVNLYRKFFPLEIFHTISPFYPQSQPPRTPTYPEERKTTFRKCLAVLTAMFLIDWMM